MEVCSAVLAGLTWRRPGWVGRISSNARRRLFVSGYCGFIGRNRYCMETSRNSTQLFIKELLTYFPADFLVSHSALQENGKGLRMTATCGRRCVESLMRFDRVGWWAKTYAAFLIGERVWSSSRCRLIWKLRGTGSGRVYCQLVVLEPSIAGTGFGLLPTPLVFPAARRLQDEKNISRSGKRTGLMLLQMARENLLPAPLDDSSGVIPGPTSQLNPRFVLEMMGFPPDWTELPFLSGGLGL